MGNTNDMIKIRTKNVEKLGAARIQSVFGIEILCKLTLMTCH